MPRASSVTVKSDGKDWGRDLWIFLHVISFAYPIDPSAAIQNAASSLVNSLMTVLVCEPCRLHFRQLLQTSPPRLGTRAEFSHWLNQAHNSVNKRLGKPEVSYAEAATKFANMTPDVWGPHAWNAMHHITFAAPAVLNQSQQQQYNAFFSSLQFLLPDKGSRDFYRLAIMKYKLSESLEGQESLSIWLIDIHNLCDMILFKPTKDYTAVRQFYLTRAPRCGIMPRK